ncbi:MAG: Multiubiquitin [Bradyrhizobium sp.]|nr:Multiubiquitin [Bradyrhizobium sp.]
MLDICLTLQACLIYNAQQEGAPAFGTDEVKMTAVFDGDKEFADDEIFEEIDIEVFVIKHPHRKKPKAHRYAFRVNKKRVVTEEPVPTREEILTLAGFTPPADYRLRLKRGKGDPLEVQPGQHVDLTEPGVERFIANKLHVQDGLSERREFQLPEEDTAFLDSLGLRWEAIRVENQLWVVIRDWRTPEGFTPEKVDIAFDVTSYPAGVIDMAYFAPAIARENGADIPQANVTVQLDGGNWQRWSRHREEHINPWNPASDSLASHYSYMLDWFQRELDR